MIVFPLYLRVRISRCSIPVSHLNLIVSKWYFNFMYRFACSFLTKWFQFSFRSSNSSFTYWYPVRHLQFSFYVSSFQLCKHILYVIFSLIHLVFILCIPLYFCAFNSLSLRLLLSVEQVQVFMQPFCLPSQRGVTRKLRELPDVRWLLGDGER